MMASVSRAGMKCRRARLRRGQQSYSAQAGHACRTNLNNIEEEAEQCGRWTVVEEARGRGRELVIIRSEFEAGAATAEPVPEQALRDGGGLLEKPSGKTLDVGAPTS